MKMQKYVCIDQMLEIDITADDVANLLKQNLKDLAENPNPGIRDFITPINAVYAVLSGYSDEMISQFSEDNRQLIYSQLDKLVQRWRPSDGVGPPAIRGSEIKKTGSHDAGAYAMCSNCGSYSDHPQSLTGNYPCHCGKSGCWSGSFKAPTSESRWSDTRPDNK